MRTAFAIVAAGAGIFALGLAMLLANWHDRVGLFLMGISLVYLIWELFTWTTAVPGMLKLCFGSLYCLLWQQFRNPASKIS
jgi:cytochrome b561